MKICCEIAKDLLPLYEDGVCSEESRKAVEEHLAECEKCRALSGAKLNVSEENTEDTERDEKAFKNGFRRIKRRWALSLIAAILIIPILLLSVNQVRGRGICFTNMDDIMTAERFAEALENGEFKKAADMIDCEKLYYDVQDVLDWELDEYIGKYRTIEIDGSRWTVSEHLYNEYVKKLSEEDIWGFMVTELNAPVVPREQFEKVASQNPEKIVKNSTDEYTLNNTEYNLVKTDHGYYYVSEDSHVNERSHIAELFYDLYIAEYELYEEMKPMILMQAEDRYNYNQEYYSEARGMTLSEFEEFIHTDYEKGLRSFAGNGFALENIRRGECSYSEIDRCWVISFDALLTRGEKTYEAAFCMRVRKDKIKVENILVNSDNEYANNNLANALHLDYPGVV